MMYLTALNFHDINRENTEKLLELNVVKPSVALLKNITIKKIP